MTDDVIRAVDRLPTDFVWDGEGELPTCPCGKGPIQIRSVCPHCKRQAFRKSFSTEWVMISGFVASFRKAKPDWIALENVK